MHEKTGRPRTNMPSVDGRGRPHALRGRGADARSGRACGQGRASAAGAARAHGAACRAAAAADTGARGAGDGGAARGAGTRGAARGAGDGGTVCGAGTSAAASPAARGAALLGRRRVCAPRAPVLSGLRPARLHRRPRHPRRRVRAQAAEDPQGGLRAAVPGRPQLGRGASARGACARRSAAERGGARRSARCGAGVDTDRCWPRRCTRTSSASARTGIGCTPTRR